jgi:hypothetical protein
MKAQVFLSEELVEEAAAMAKELSVPLGELIRMALVEYLKRRRDEAVTAALNRSLAEHPDEVDPLVQHFAIETLKRAG